MLNKDFSLDDYIDFSGSVSDSIKTLKYVYTCDASFFSLIAWINNQTILYVLIQILRFLGATVYLKI